jgi:excisionase family DNA binding protein
MNLADLKQLVGMKPWVAPGEAAAILGVSRQRVTELLNEGKLESFPFLGARHVLLSSIIERLEKRCKLPKKASVILQ